MAPTNPNIRPCPVPHCRGTLVRDMAGEWTCTLGAQRHVPPELRGEARPSEPRRRRGPRRL